MESRIKDQIDKLDLMRERLHKKYLVDGSMDELLSLSQEMDELILQYFRIEKMVRSNVVK